jgi:hypothetical protein
MCKRKHNDLLRVVRNSEKVSNCFISLKTDKDLGCMDAERVKSCSFLAVRLTL